MSHKRILSSISVPKIMKVGGDLTKLWQNNFGHRKDWACWHERGFRPTQRDATAKTQRQKRSLRPFGQLRYARPLRCVRCVHRVARKPRCTRKYTRARVPNRSRKMSLETGKMPTQCRPSVRPSSQQHIAFHHSTNPDPNRDLRPLTSGARMCQSG